MATSNLSHVNVTVPKELSALPSEPRDTESMTSESEWTSALSSAPVKLGLSAAQHYARLLCAHDVSLDMAAELSVELLKEMGVARIGHRLKLLRLVHAPPPHSLSSPLPVKTSSVSSTTSTATSTSQPPAKATSPSPVSSPRISSPASAPAPAPIALSSGLEEVSSVTVLGTPSSPSSPSSTLRSEKSASMPSLSSLTASPSIASALISASATASVTPSSASASSSTGIVPSKAHHVPALKYYVNDELTKYRMPMPELHPLSSSDTDTDSDLEQLYAEEVKVSDFVSWLREHHRPLLTEDFAVWHVTGVDEGDAKLHVLKSEALLRVSEPYFVLYHSRLQALSKRLERRVRKELDTQLPRTAAGKPVWTSDNYPLKVDYVPAEELYLNEMGRLGLCMAPGRTKKKSEHQWARDLGKDLDRVRVVYGCDVLVTLLRHQEMIDINTPNLLEEVERRGMESIHFPIKDKWIPNSMEQVIALVETIIARLRKGLTVVAHCNGGKGRSGTVLVATLVALGRRVQQAIDVVRQARSGTIRNPLQIVYVKRFKSAWAKRVQERRSLTLVGSSSTSTAASASASSTSSSAFPSSAPVPIPVTATSAASASGAGGGGGTDDDEQLNAEEFALWRAHLAEREDEGFSPSTTPPNETRGLLLSSSTSRRDLRDADKEAIKDKDKDKDKDKGKEKDKDKEKEKDKEKSVTSTLSTAASNPSATSATSANATATNPTAAPGPSSTLGATGAQPGVKQQIMQRIASVYQRTTGKGGSGSADQEEVKRQEKRVAKEKQKLDKLSKAVEKQRGKVEQHELAKASSTTRPTSATHTGTSAGNSTSHRHSTKDATTSHPRSAEDEDEESVSIEAMPLSSSSDTSELSELIQVEEANAVLLGSATTSNLTKEDSTPKDSGAKK